MAEAVIAPGKHQKVRVTTYLAGYLEAIELGMCRSQRMRLVSRVWQAAAFLAVRGLERRVPENLEPHEFEVSGTRRSSLDGEEGLQLARRETPNLILCDLTCPSSMASSSPADTL